jgi:hypothetical protein
MTQYLQCVALAVSCATSVSLSGCAPADPNSGTARSEAKDYDSRGSKAPDVASDGPSILTQEALGDLLKPSTSLIQVLAHPADYHGKRVFVEGFLRVEREGNAIYLSETDDRYMILGNAFWVAFEGNELRLNREEITKQFSGRYVVLGGTFDKENHGHMGAFQGEFNRITRIAVLLDRSELKKLHEDAKHKQ